MSDTKLKIRLSKPEFSVKARKQVVLMLGAVVLSFFVCLLPFRVLTLWIIFVPEETFHSLNMETYYNLLYFCRIMWYLNSAINPILYNLMSSKFRKGFFKLCRCYSIGQNKRYIKGRARAATFNTTTTSSYLTQNTTYNHQHHHYFDKNTDGNKTTIINKKAISFNDLRFESGKKINAPDGWNKTNTMPYSNKRCFYANISNNKNQQRHLQNKATDSECINRLSTSESLIQKQEKETFLCSQKICQNNTTTNVSWCNDTDDLRKQAFKNNIEHNFTHMHSKGTTSDGPKPSRIDYKKQISLDEQLLCKCIEIELHRNMNDSVDYNYLNLQYVQYIDEAPEEPVRSLVLLLNSDDSA